MTIQAIQKRPEYLESGLLDTDINLTDKDIGDKIENLETYMAHEQVDYEHKTGIYKKRLNALKEML